MTGRLYQRVSRQLIGWTANRFVACGRAAAEYLFPGRKDVALIPNAVDIDKFASASGDGVRAAIGIPDDHLVIVQVGRFMPVKNHVRSVEIARELRRAGVDFRMLMVGDGPERPGIESMVQQHALDGSVLFLGMRTDIPELMAAADVMLMPSFHEGFPVVLVEAQAAGLPSVVSSAVSPEVELGMDMVRFVGLDAPDGEWAEALQGAAVCAIPAGYTRRVVLRTAGFSAASGARRLEEIYEVA
jgi:glycosyltransferase EpsF